MSDASGRKISTSNVAPQDICQECSDNKCLVCEHQPSRRRLVVGRMFEYFVCDVHGWDFGEDDSEDVCPVCLGEQIERHRILTEVSSPESFIWHNENTQSDLIEFILGEKND